VKLVKRCFIAVSMLATGMSPVFSAETIEVWHALEPAHKAALESLVKQFNREQDDVVVKLQAAPTMEALESSLRQVVASKKPLPHLVQLSDQHAPEAVAQANRIMPLYELLAKYPIADAQWFLPQTTSFVRDSRGRLLALPYMAEIPVMFYNRDLFKKAGLNPDEPAKTWADLQKQLIRLQEAGVQCPYASSRTVWIHQENLASVNNKPFASHNNGFDGAPAPLLINSLLHVRHLALMTSWVRSRLLTQASEGTEPDALFAKGECAVLTSGTGAWAQLGQSRFSAGVAPLPFTPDSSNKTPGAPLVGGSSFWVVAGHPTPQQKATASFIAWLTKPAVAAQWHQATGFLPITDAAARAADVSFYQKIPGAQQVVQLVKTNAGKQRQGLRLTQYPAVRAILAEETMAALNGQKPPMKAQADAVARTTQVLSGKR